MLRGLILVAALALAGAAEPERWFENRDYGHKILVPAGWTAQIEPESRQTHVSTYTVRRLDGFEQPPRGHLHITFADYGRRPCPRGAIPEGSPIRLGERTSFEGFVGYTVAFCRRGHSLQAFVPAGPSVPAGRLDKARRIVASLQLTARAHEIANVHSVRQLGRSVEGRPIRAWRIGNPKAKRRLLVVGCIHGNECEGMRVTQQLVNLIRPIALDLWVIQNVNPDGLAARSRGNARGVDLNRDFLAATQPETRIARKLIQTLQPEVTLWFHQPQSVVRAWGPSRALARRYARLAGVPYRSLAWPPGSASRWQNGIGQRSFVVELPAGELPLDAAIRYANAVLRLPE